MSGGLDSTITAWKLKDQGFNVLGIHFRFWKWGDDDEKYKHEVEELHNLTYRIGIDLEEIDARDSFKKIVIKEMGHSLKAGLTPNPCIHCNPKMKFKLLMDFADNNKIDFIATGHYALSKIKENEEIGLFLARDKGKDQTYFLCQLNQNILMRSLFPLGTTLKSENKKTAEDMGLNFKNKPESQDLCFLSNRSYSDFIREKIPEIMKPGKIIDTTGNEIGQHKGLPNYTIGQRKGINISSTEPYYVIEKDVPNNKLIVGHAEKLKFHKMIVTKVNWLSFQRIKMRSCDVKIRYGSPFYRCEISSINGCDYLIEFNHDIRDITPGQYAVFYENDEMLGGGMIKSVGKNDV